ncbi:MAG TPA: M28 family peptidase [Gemmataceae bacterium]|nr:M28 family peptidase [Gemmataceae bacterium]
MNSPIPFDANRAYDHTEALCYPRRVGTSGERRAARYVARQFAALGLVCWRERFVVSFFPAEIGNRLVFLACAILVVAAVLTAGAYPWLTALCAGTAALLANAPWRVQFLRGRCRPPWAISENVLATLPESAKGAPARVVFLAHYDTKSQWLPTGVRVALVTGTAGVCALFALAALAAALGLPAGLEMLGPWRLGPLALLLLAGLLLNFTGNRCPGALDNGSAVGTLLELARCWRPQPGTPVEAVWVATGSEEVELDGARHLLRAHASWWQDKPTLVINLESVGAGGRVFLAGEARALRLAREEADRLGMEHALLAVLGAGMDHEPFAARGLPAVSILGDVVRRSFALHSRRDNMSLIERPALERAGRLAAHLAWRWAALHRPPVLVHNQEAFGVSDRGAGAESSEPQRCGPGHRGTG